MSETASKLPSLTVSRVRFSAGYGGSAFAVMDDGKEWRLSGEEITEALNRARGGWFPIDTAPKDEMFIWAYRRDGKWSIGLAYRNVSGGWSCAYGSDAPQHATHWAPLPSPPEIGS